MPTTRMTIKYVNPPLEGKSRGTIKDADGNKMLVAPGQLHLFEPGRAYDILYVKTGDWKTVQSATAVEAPPPGRTPTAAPSAPAAGGTHGGGEKDEQIFVCALLKEAIRAALVPIDKDALTMAIKHIRYAYRAGFGSNTFTAGEAAGGFTSGVYRQARG